jgi:putative ABC transport system permease protein
VALELLLNESEKQLMSRAVSTPLVLGAKGSALDLVMNTLYFNDEVPELITVEASNQVMDTELALPIPLYDRFQARGNPIVGTTLDYFDFRGLRIAHGRQLAVLGDCVLGARVAESLDLKPGDSLVSSPETLFDLAGVYPLKMKVVGVLEKSHTSDDLAVFVDLKTAWVIQGLGHGHEDVTRLQDPTLVLKRTEKNVAATAKLYQYAEIRDENIDSFHFHGDTSKYPLTAVIAVPHDDKSGTILRGRYLNREETRQIVRPRVGCGHFSGCPRNNSGNYSGVCPIPEFAKARNTNDFQTWLPTRDHRPAPERGDFHYCHYERRLLWSDDIPG